MDYRSLTLQNTKMAKFVSASLKIHNPLDWHTLFSIKYTYKVWFKMFLWSKNHNDWQFSHFFLKPDMHQPICIRHGLRTPSKALLFQHIPNVWADWTDRPNKLIDIFGSTFKGISRFWVMILTLKNLEYRHHASAGCGINWEEVSRNLWMELIAKKEISEWNWLAK